jgi:glyoxylase-like metal-dependent hydrolase (beta-lactamase superfamily II)
LTALVVTGGLTAAAFQPGGSQPREVTVEKVKDNLYVMRGGGGNSAVFITATGVVVVDTKNPGWGQPLLDKIKTVTDKPVTTIINTHTHGDHVSGNVEFPATVEVVTHVTTEANMKEMRPVTGLAKPGAPPAPNIFTQNSGRGLPKRTFKDRMTIGRAPNRSISIISVVPTPAVTPTWCSPPIASCTSATPSRTRTCRSWIRTTAAAASTMLRR